MARSGNDLTPQELKQKEIELRDKLRVTSMTVSAKNPNGCFVSFTVTPDQEEESGFWSASRAREVAAFVAKEVSVLSLANSFILGTVRGTQVTQEKPLIDQRFETTLDSLNKLNKKDENHDDRQH